MRPSVHVLVAGLAGVLALAGCTSTSSGKAEPAPTGSPGTETTQSTPQVPSSSARPSATSLPSHGAPKVRNPLDTSRFQQNPCLALTAAQAQELNLPQSEPVPAPLGNACSWSNSDTWGHVNFQFGDKDPRGLSAAYEANKDGKWAYFEVLPEIEGFPVVARSSDDRRDKGECVLAIGVSDTVSFQLSGFLSRANIGKKDPCEMTVMAAGMMLRTMKAGG